MSNERQHQIMDAMPVEVVNWQQMMIEYSGESQEAILERLEGLVTHPDDNFGLPELAAAIYEELNG